MKQMFFFFQVEKKDLFDFENIVQIVRDEHTRDICVIKIPPEQQQARYVILATVFTARHWKITSEQIKLHIKNMSTNKLMLKLKLKKTIY